MAPTYWSYSRVVQTSQSMVTLFDPTDLRHHQDDPEDWYRYDYGFLDDLESGRFVALTTPYNGQVKVRITSSPLTEIERAAAGPRATLRLRVLNGRLLLAGGDAWPSLKKRVDDLAFDSRYLPFRNGDYRVTATVLDRAKSPGHDVIIQFREVNDIVDVRHAPGFPHLVVGKPAAVTGLNAVGFRFQEECTSIPSVAEWTPLTTQYLPLPGTTDTIEVSDWVYSRGLALQNSGKAAAIPLVLSQNTTAGSVGVYLAPANWQSAHQRQRDRALIQADVLCAVEITGTALSDDKLMLKLRPLPGSSSPIPQPIVSDLANRFAAWARFTNLPGWKFKGEQARRAVNHRSLITGVMSNLNLAPGDAASLLSLSSEARALKVLDRLPVDW
ncbi:MAG: hypothetical protein KTR33_13235 [Gammaproteobacteria bacterium]|nr:hypothetical protein [Gammaproteobacteria bacterium]